MFRSENKKNGFTLVEVVVSLVLLGIMGAIVGMGMVNIANSYFFSARNLVTAQKSTQAISRLEKELSAVKVGSITGATASSITFTRAIDNVTDTISVNGSNLLSNTSILTDQVNAFTLTYFTCAAGAYNNCVAGAYNANTTIIGVNLVLIPQAGMTVTVPFTDRIYIRPYNR
jgi:prepilin-type N-terminal cleavage/methylation domain-containing protein